MKVGPKVDIAVQVKLQEWEEDEDVAPFYRGIYEVTLNFFTDVMFIPSFPRTLDSWPPTLPKNVDDVHSVYEARLFTVALSENTVTPNAFLAGQQELIPLSPSLNGEPRMGRIFYVTPEQFALFSQELAQIMQQTLSVHDYVSLLKVNHFACIQFITFHFGLDQEVNSSVTQLGMPVFA